MNHGLWLDFAIVVTPEVGVCCLGHLRAYHSLAVHAYCAGIWGPWGCGLWTVDSVEVLSS